MGWDGLSVGVNTLIKGSNIVILAH